MQTQTEFIKRALRGSASHNTIMAAFGSAGGIPVHRSEPKTVQQMAQEAPAVSE